ncbi:MAG: carboxypeptidase regulatory-like domain-containing protein [Gemmatimonadota bacterium]
MSDVLHRMFRSRAIGVCQIDRRCVLAVAIGLVAVLGMAAPPASGQVLTGTVVAFGTREPVEGAVVSVLPARVDSVVRSTLSSQTGRFAVRIRTPGRYRLRVEHLAFGTVVTAARELPRDAVVDVQVELRTEPVSLAPLSVQGERLEPPYMQDIRDRMAMPWGEFLTREELKRLSGHRLAEVLSTVPGVRAYSRGGLLQVQIPRTESNPACSRRGPRIFLGGAPFTGGDFLRLLTADEVEAIEVYRGVAEVPGAFARTGTNCGVVAIWLRHSLDSEVRQVGPRAEPLDIAVGLGGTGAGGRLGGLSSPGIGWYAQAHWRWHPNVWLGIALNGTYYSVGASSNTGSATGVSFEPRLVRSQGILRPFVAVRAGVARRGQRPVEASYTSWGVPLGTALGVLIGAGRPATDLELAGVWERTAWGPLRLDGYELADSRTAWSTLGVRIAVVRRLGDAQR